MPAQFEIIYPDKSVSFVTLERAGEPLYIWRDAAGVISLSQDAAGDPIVMLLEAAPGVMEVSAFHPDHVLINGAPLQGTQRLAPDAEIGVDDHLFILLPDESAAVAQDGTQSLARVFVDSVRQSGERDGVTTFTVTVRTAGPHNALEPKVFLEVDMGRLQETFIPLTNAQREDVMLTFPSGDVLNMKVNDTRSAEFAVRLKSFSSRLMAGRYCLRVTAAFARGRSLPDSGADVELVVPAFKKFDMGDPMPARHNFPRWVLWPKVSSTVAITNEGNIDTDFTVLTENAPNSDCRVDLMLLPRADAPADVQNLLPDTGKLESSPQPQRLQGLRIHPDETRHVRVSLNAQSQPIASLRHSHYQVNVSVSAEGVAQMSKPVRMVVAPIAIGPLRVLLLLLLMAVALVLHVKAMNDHTALLVGPVCPAETSEQGDTQSTMSLQEHVVFSICSVPFTDVTLEKLAFNATPEVSAITEVSKTIAFDADRSASYRLTATHPLGRLLPWPPFVVRRSLDFGMRDDRAPTGEWNVKPLNVPIGGEVTVFWKKVDHARRLTLYENGAPNVIPVENISAGQMKFTLSQPTTFLLEAVSISGKQFLLTQVVNIIAPTMMPTPLPTPAITRFDVSPAQVVSGQPVLLQWEVAGPADALTVTLFTNGVPALVPASAAIYQIPQSEDSGYRIYQLIAYNGQTAASAMRQVQVLMPTPVPTPTPGPIGKPNYDAACGGVGRADLRQLGEHWKWVCRDNPLADISDKVCREQYGDTAYARAENEGLKETWVCWR